MSADGEGRKPPKKSDTLQIRIPHATKEEFLEACQSEGENASEVLRQSILDYLMRRKPAPKPREDIVLAIPAFLRRRRILVGSAIAIGATALAVLPSAADPNFRAAFNRLDANHDGALTPDEYFSTDDGLPWTITADAMVLPANTDDVVFLDYDGADAGGNDRGIEIKAATPAPASRGLPRSMDANGDGQVDFAEYQASQLQDLRARFDKMDRNNDGMLGLDELTLKPLDLTGVRSAVTVSPDGRVTMGLPAPPRQGEKSPVAKADANKDGIVTLDEYLASRTRP